MDALRRGSRREEGARGDSACAEAAVGGVTAAVTVGGVTVTMGGVNVAVPVALGVGKFGVL